MNQFSIHLKSKDAGNIYVNGSFVGLIDNVRTFCLDLRVYCNQLVVTKEPISNQKKLLLPYTVKLDFNESVTCESDYATIVPFKQKEYDVVLDECDVKHHKKLEKVYDDYVDNYNIIVVNDGVSYVNVYQMNVLKFSTTIPEITAVVCEKQNHHILLKGATLNGKYYLLVLNENTFTPVVNTACEQVEQTPEQLKYLVKLNDIAHHASVFTLGLQDGQTSEHYYVYLNENAHVTESTKLIPYAFLEALKVNNTDLAKQYLAPALLQKTTNEHLTAFFSDVQNIYYNPYHNQEGVVNYTVKTNTYKSYDFFMQENKIAEIEEVDL